MGKVIPKRTTRFSSGVQSSDKTSGRPAPVVTVPQQSFSFS